MNPDSKEPAASRAEERPSDGDKGRSTLGQKVAATFLSVGTTGLLLVGVVGAFKALDAKLRQNSDPGRIRRDGLLRCASRAKKPGVHGHSR